MLSNSTGDNYFFRSQNVAIGEKLRHRSWWWAGHVSNSAKKNLSRRKKKYHYRIRRNICWIVGRIPMKWSPGAPKRLTLVWQLIQYGKLSQKTPSKTKKKDWRHTDGFALKMAMFVFRQLVQETIDHSDERHHRLTHTHSCFLLWFTCGYQQTCEWKFLFSYPFCLISTLVSFRYLNVNLTFFLEYHVTRATIITTDSSNQMGRLDLYLYWWNLSPLSCQSTGTSSSNQKWPRTITEDACGPLQGRRYWSAIK